MNILGMEISSRDFILGVGLAGLIIFSLWFHSEATGMGFTPSSILCSLCH